MPKGIVTETWAHPRDAAGFACQWRSEVRAASALGERVGRARYLEVFYEDLVREPGDALRRICAFADLPYAEQMLGYAGEVDVSAKPHQQRLRQAPTPGVRDWRSQMARNDALAFERIAGDVLAELGYPLLDAANGSGPGPRERALLAAYRARLAAFNAAAFAMQRSPLWRRRHPPLGEAPRGSEPQGPSHFGE